MAFLGKIAWLITRLALTLLAQLLLIFLRLLQPVVFIFLGWLLSLVTTSFTAAVSGPRQYQERLASEWTRRLINFGISRDHLGIAYDLCRFFAVFVIALGWVVAILVLIVGIWIVSEYFI